MTLRLGVPKGSLQNATVQLFARAGFAIYIDPRSYFPTIDDVEIECLLVRAQEMPRYVADGVLDAGLTGQDWIAEHAEARGANTLTAVADLAYAKQSFRRVRWVLAVPEESHAFSGPRTSPAARWRPNWCAWRNPISDGSRSTSASSFRGARPRSSLPQLADAIVEVTETGSSLRANRLRVIDTVMESHTQLITGPAAQQDAWKRTKVQNIALLLRAAMEAQGRVGLMLNVQRSDLDGGTGVAARAPAPDHLAAERRGMGRRQHHHR